VTLTQGGAPVKGSNIWEIYKAGADGSRGSYLDTQYGDYAGTLAPGAYVVVARLGEARAEQKLTVVAGETYKPAFVLNAGTLRVHPRPSAGAEVDPVAHIEVSYPGDRATTYGDATLVLPAGEQTVTVSIGSGKKTETVQLAAGQTLDKDIIVGVGRATLNAYYAEGGDKVDGNAVSFRIVKAEKKADGSREDIERAYGAGAKFDLPPADYVAIANADLASAEQPFTVKVGEANNIKINLNAGVLIISAPGADTTELFARDAQGNRKSLGLDYGDKRQEAVPAGDYIVVRNLPDDGGSKEMPVTVKPGGRTEITVQ
jgi:Ca-activated chloride channel homolog